VDARSLRAVAPTTRRVLTPAEHEFLSAVSHELRAPLTVAIGHLELSIDQLGTDAVPPVVIDELTRMGRIIDDLGSLALADRADYVVPEILESIVFADELLLKMSALAPRDWSLGTVESVTFVADRYRLTEAVLNLADNAVGATWVGDRVVLSIRRQGTKLVIEMADTGVGIEAGDIDRVLLRFERGERARHRYRGAGLGLTVVQAIAEAHRGQLDIDSQVGVGTTASLIIELVEPPAVERKDDPDPDR
jgi:signal transduction histidine kinase